MKKHWIRALALVMALMLTVVALAIAEDAVGANSEPMEMKEEEPVIRATGVDSVIEEAEEFELGESEDIPTEEPTEEDPTEEEPTEEEPTEEEPTEEEPTEEEPTEEASLDAESDNLPTANELTYTGEAQALVSGEGWLYALDGENYSAEPPTAINAGEYIVYYLPADAIDAEPQTLTVTIAKADVVFSAPVAATWEA